MTQHLRDKVTAFIPSVFVILREPLKEDIDAHHHHQAGPWGLSPLALSLLQEALGLGHPPPGSPQMRGS